MYVKRTIVKVENWGERWQVVYALEHVPETPEEVGYVEQSGHCFPKDIFEWRAAEYDIDPSDMDTLLDIVLAEPFLTEADYSEGETLRDAPTLEEARQAHVARCSQGKLRGRVTTRGKISQPGGLLYRIKTESFMDPEALSLKREFVDRERNAYRQEQAKKATREEPQDRVEKLRSSLSLLANEKGKSRG